MRILGTDRTITSMNDEFTSGIPADFAGPAHSLLLSGEMPGSPIGARLPDAPSPVWGGYYVMRGFCHDPCSPKMMTAFQEAIYSEW